MAAPAPNKPLIEVEEKPCKKTTVTLVRFLQAQISDAGDIESIGEQLYSLVEDNGRKNFVLDLSGVQFAASYFVGKMIGLLKRTKKVSGRLALVIKPGSLVDEVFEVCGLRHQFEIFATVEEALRSF